MADTWNLRIQKLAIDFVDGEPVVRFVKEWPVEAWSAQSVVNKPFVAVDSTGQVYVTDPEGYRVLAFDSEGQFKAVFGLYRQRCAEFRLTQRYCHRLYGDRVFVADADNHRLLVFPPVR